MHRKPENCVSEPNTAYSHMKLMILDTTTSLMYVDTDESLATAAYQQGDTEKFAYLQTVVCAESYGVALSPHSKKVL